MQTTILMNANAGLHKDTATPEQMRELLSSLEIKADIVETQSQEHMCQTIRELQERGIETIAVAGGDGTIHAAVQCLARSDTTLAVIPQGTRNNFAHALGLPLQLENSVKVLKEGRVMEVDLGKTMGIFFTEAAGVGVFADILDVYGESNKNLWRGLYAIARTYLNLRAKRLRLTLDGQVVSERAVMCTVANGYRIGFGAPVAPGASVADGVLDIVILGDLTRLELIRYYRAVKSNTHLQLPKVSQVQAREVKIEAAKPLALHVDDRVIGTTPAFIQVVPRSLKVLVK